MTPVIPLSPLRIENNRLGIECWFTGPPLQVGYGDLQIEPAARELKRCRAEFRGPKCPLALFEAPTPSRGIPRKLVSSLPFEFSSWKTDTAYFPTLRRGIEGTKNLATFVAQSGDFHVE